MKLRDLELANDILKIVDEEVTAIMNSTAREPSDIVKLEKLSKVYVTIMANQRELLKQGVLGKLSEEELGEDDEEV
jgi:hypothetical protein